MQLIVDGLATNYSRQGHGQLVLILPGWGDDSRGWSAFAKKLARDYDVVVLDLPGFGGTQDPPTAWDLSDYARFVQSFLSKAQLEPFAIIGHSNGGGIAIRGTARGWLQPKRLVLLASAGIRGEDETRNRALRRITKTGKLLTTPLPNKLKRRLRGKVYQAIGSDMLVAEKLQTTFKRVVTDDVQRDASLITVPTLLVYGEEDRATPLRYGQTFSRAIAGSSLQVVPAAGHFLHIDQPAVVSDYVTEFLK